MGGVWKKIPFTWGLMLIGTLALTGFPFLSGFYSKDAIIETVAEEVLSQQKPVAVLNNKGKIVGILNCSTILHILFGDRAGSK